MGLTNFPNGISSFGIPIYGTSAASPPLTGTVLFVDTVNGTNAGSGNSPTNPYQTVAYALTQVPSGAYATIYVLPGSTTTISSATSLLLDVANVSIVGLGYGTQRPLFNFTTANTAAIPVSAANVSVSNCRHTANFLSIARAYTVTAAGFKLDGNSFVDASGVLNFLNIVNCTGAANTADRLTITNNRWDGSGTTSVNSFLLTANDIDQLEFSGNLVDLLTTTDAASGVTVTAGVLTSASIAYNRTYRKNTATTAGALVNLSGTTSTGMINNNYCLTLDASAPLLFTATTGLGAFENYVSGAITLSGILTPANV
jgi:hypothetical protein